MPTILKNTEENGQRLQSSWRLRMKKWKTTKMPGSVMNKAIVLSPLNSSYYRNYAIILARKGDTDEAEKVLEKARENGMDSVAVNYVEGEIYFASGRYEEAKQIFMDCLNKK